MRAVLRVSRAGLSSLVLALGATFAQAQTAVLRGTVTDSTGRAIADADIGIVALHRLARTDVQGRFAIDRLESGTVEVSIRRLGYVPQAQKLAVNEAIAISYSITLVAQPTTLEGVDVTEKRRRTGIEEFYQRRTRGIGKYFTRDDLLARNARAPSDILQSTPGVKFVRSGTKQLVRFVTPSNGRRDCFPLIWVDGQAAPGMELDDIPVEDIEGMEVYQSISTTPAQFHRPSTTSCGTIVVWSRSPGG